MAATTAAVVGAIKDSAETIDKVNDKIDETTVKLEENRSKLKELQSTPWYDRTSEINDEILALQAENAELEKNLQYYEGRKNILENPVDAGYS